MAKNSNRLGITIRMNLEEQAELRRLCVKYRKSDRDLIKMGFYLLVDSDQQMEAAQKAKKEQEQEAENASQTQDNYTDGGNHPDRGVPDLAAEQQPSDSPAATGADQA